MGIQNASILTGATISATGGTSSTLVPTGLTIANGIQVQDQSGTDARLFPTCTYINRPAQYNRATKTWSKGKRTGKIVIPRLMTDGSIEYPLGEVRIEDFPEMTDAERLKILTWLAQMVGFDADFTAFFLKGNIS